MNRFTIIVAWACLSVFAAAADAAELAPLVELEEDVYTYSDAGNGAGPMWCLGSTCLFRIGDRVFVAGLDTVPGANPLNNCRWTLFTRDADGWRRVQVDETSGFR